ncbi:MAG: HAD family hydrolase [Gammaproteobacteria bacterium]|nr:HAD family hydrolase [Gammaproteobacteria bacterium]NND60095.1 HAD-IIB family hydrolase [Gammaproteobacteria bacterium]
MELIVFDLDGTLLDGNAEISSYTSDTLRMLAAQGIAYTVATGRTLHASRTLLDGQGFALPQVFKNGVLVWHPNDQRLTSGALLTMREVDRVVSASTRHDVTPFVFTLDATVYHPRPINRIEHQLLVHFDRRGADNTRMLDELPNDAEITHVSAIGPAAAIRGILDIVSAEEHLVAYSGVAYEGQQWRWLDVHHSNASKGGAIVELKEQLGFERVICFGDSENDVSLFEIADEAYAPGNAAASIKDAATAVIGRHDEEGIARFLRRRFDLD